MTVNKLTQALMIAVTLSISASAGSTPRPTPPPTPKPKPAPVAPAKVAEGVMVRINPGEESLQYALVNGETYRFDSYAGEPMFENRYRNFFLYDCTNPNGCNEAEIAAAAPAPSAGMALANANNNECRFLKGGALNPLEYEQMRITSDYVAVYYYEVVPVVESVEPLTNFQYVGTASDPTKAIIPVRAEIAAQQASINSLQKATYSFSLRNAAGQSRVSNLILWTEAPEYWGGNTSARTVDHALKENCAGCRPGTSGGTDFNHETQIASADSTTTLRNGFARSLLNSDSVTWNDDGGSDGSHLAMAKATVDLELPSGFHQVKLSGTLTPGTIYKSSMEFKAQSNLRIITPGNPWCE